MKKIILLLTLSGIGTTALAEKPTKFWTDYCESLTDIAIVAQILRQQNYSSSDILKKLEPIALSLGEQELIDQQKRMNLHIVESAFIAPIYQTQEEKESEIINFTAGFRDGCINNPQINN